MPLASQVEMLDFDCPSSEALRNVVVGGQVSSVARVVDF
jgi:hypothetical protein